MANSIKKTAEEDMRLLSASTRSKKVKKEPAKTAEKPEVPQQKEVICPACGNALEKMELPGYGRCFAHRSKRMCDKIFRNFKELRAFEEDLKAETTIEKNVNSETTKYRQIDILTDNDSTIEEKGLGPEITHNITLEEYEEAGRDIFKIIKSKEPMYERILPKAAAKPEKPEIKRLQRKRSDNVTIKRATVKDGQITKITNDGMTTFLGGQSSDGRTVLLSSIGKASSDSVFLIHTKTNQKILVDIKKAKEKDGFSIGRVKPCDYILPDETISRLHAKIFCIDGIFFIEDFSSNGTYIAKDKDFKTVFRLPKESKVELITGCYISFAEEVYEFKLGDPEDGL